MTYHNAHIQPKLDAALKNRQALNKAILDQANKDRKHNLDVYKATNTANYQQGQLGVAQQNASTTAYTAQINATKVASDIAKKEETGNTKSENQTNTYAKSLGNGWRNQDNTLNANVIQNTLLHQLSAMGKASQYLTDDISDNDYATFIAKNIKTGSEQHLKRELDAYEYKGRKLTNSEKKLLFTEFAGDMNRWFSNEDKIEEYINAKVVTRNTAIANKQYKCVQDSLIALTKLGYTPEQLVQEL